MTLFTLEVDALGTDNNWVVEGPGTKLHSVQVVDDGEAIYEAGTDGVPSTVNGLQSFLLAALPVSVIRVDSITTKLRCKRGDPGDGATPSFRPYVKAAGSRIHGTVVPHASISTSYTGLFTETFLDDPATSAPYLEMGPDDAQAHLAATEIGIQWYSDVDGSGVIKCDFVEADVEAVAVTGGFTAMICQVLLPVFGSGLLGAFLDSGHARLLARELAFRTRGRVRVRAGELARLATEAGTLGRRSRRGLVFAR